MFARIKQFKLGRDCNPSWMSDSQKPERASLVSENNSNSGVRLISSLSLWWVNKKQWQATVRPRSDVLTYCDSHQSVYCSLTVWEVSVSGWIENITQTHLICGGVGVHVLLWASSAISMSSAAFYTAATDEQHAAVPIFNSGCCSRKDLSQINKW